MVDKKPKLIKNAIPDQLKTGANSLTIHEWNQIINILKTQANLNTDFLETVQRQNEKSISEIMERLAVLNIPISLDEPEDKSSGRYWFKII